MTSSRDSHSEDIWRGKIEALFEARRRYQEDPYGGLLPWASVLYSFREIAEYRQELIDLLLDKLLPLAEDLRHRARDKANKGEKDEELADKAETLSAILYWLSQQSRRKVIAKDEAYLAARELVRQGLRITAAASGGHTAALFGTTYAFLLRTKQARTFGDRNALREEAGAALACAQKLAPLIKDKNQQTRVWKRLGWILLSRLKLREGWQYLRLARGAPGVPEAVRRKVLRP